MFASCAINENSFLSALCMKAGSWDRWAWEEMYHLFTNYVDMQNYYGRILSQSCSIVNIIMVPKLFPPSHIKQWTSLSLMWSFSFLLFIFFICIQTASPSWCRYPCFIDPIDQSFPETDAERQMVHLIIRHMLFQSGPSFLHMTSQGILNT